MIRRCKEINILKYFLTTLSDSCTMIDFGYQLPIQRTMNDDLKYVINKCEKYYDLYQKINCLGSDIKDISIKIIPNVC